MRAFYFIAAIALAGCYQIAEIELDPETGTGSDSASGAPHLDAAWIAFAGGPFTMGEAGMLWSEPVHLVHVPAFELASAEVTVADYAACVDAGACAAPAPLHEHCNWDATGRDDHPINCLDWQRASAYCAYAGGRLPTESEWEFAARSGGLPIAYPWGNATADCSRAVMDGGTSGEASGYGCGALSTAPVCSKPAGISNQGLCDLAGNVAEWVADWFHDSYEGHPTDGSAWLQPAGSFRVIRGGGYTLGAYHLRATKRDHLAPGPLTGVRCAR